MNKLPTQERSPWAIVSIVLVVVLFGIFWWWQQRSLSDPALPMPFSETTSMNGDTSPSSAFDLTSLEASAVNISIPSFESLF